MKEGLLGRLRNGEPLSFQEQLLMIVQLSLPAIVAQISSIVMQYIDASMVGQLGASDSASIGLVSSSTWLFNGICSAVIVGFTVQVAQSIGAGEIRTARQLMKQAFFVCVGFTLCLSALGVLLHRGLPAWLGGEAAVQKHASQYFLVFALALPVAQLNSLAGGMLQSSGNMRVPSALNVMMCALDVVFNALLIFPSREVFGILVPGAELGVMGAAIGTALAQLVTACLMLWFLLVRSPMLHLRRGEGLSFSKDHLLRAAKIAIPVGFEQVILCGAQIASTKIVSPLGTVSIAANSFSITAESLCYMPGYGIGTAATTLIGQSIGARRHDLTRRLGYLCTGLGMTVMTLSGCTVFGRSHDDWAAQPRSGDCCARRTGAAHRGVCGTDVCRVYRRLGGLSRCRGYAGAEQYEFSLHVDHPSAACGLSGAKTWSARRMDCDVHRTLHPRRVVFDPSARQTLDGKSSDSALDFRKIRKRRKQLLSPFSYFFGLDSNMDLSVSSAFFSMRETYDREMDSFCETSRCVKGCCPCSP